MKKMMVTITVQTHLDYDEMDEDSYTEELDQLVSDLEDMGLTVNVDSEEPADDEDEDEELN